jgi:hypothetical protein
MGLNKAQDENKDAVRQPNRSLLTKDSPRVIFLPKMWKILLSI